MIRKPGWFQIGFGLLLPLLVLMIFPACSTPLIAVKVDAQCEPKGVNEPPPAGRCIRWDPSTGQCIKWA